MATQNYVLLQRITTTAAVGTVTFSSIPQTGYTDLKVVASLRTEEATVNSGGSVAFASSDSLHSYRRLYGYYNGGSATGSDANSSQSSISFGNINGASCSTGSYANFEMYVANYASSNTKTIYIENVMDSDTTNLMFTQLNGASWASSSGVSQIIFGGYGNFAIGCTFSLYGIAALNTIPASSPKAYGGDIIVNDGSYWYHAFLSSGVFTPQANLTCNYFLVGGGASGGVGRNTAGDRAGGGGGAGGFLAYTNQSFTLATNYPVGIGAGATAVSAGNTSGNIGNSTTFNGQTALYGGASCYPTQIITGGSGGGADVSGGTIILAGLGTSGQGNNGGNAYSSNGGASGGVNAAGGGGGGASAVGGNASTATGGTGGAGNNTYSSYATATSTGVSGYYAGGGGGGGYTTAGAGGSGGGGAGSNYSGGNATTGTKNTGGGGGGTSTTATSGAGGSGIVVIRYAM
jgi:hypothetical protein